MLYQSMLHLHKNPSLRPGKHFCSIQSRVLTKQLEVKKTPGYIKMQTSLSHVYHEVGRKPHF